MQCYMPLGRACSVSILCLLRHGVACPSRPFARVLPPSAKAPRGVSGYPKQWRKLATRRVCGPVGQAHHKSSDEARQFSNRRLGLQRVRSRCNASLLLCMLVPHQTLPPVVHLLLVSPADGHAHLPALESHCTAT